MRRDHQGTLYVLGRHSVRTAEKRRKKKRDSLRSNFDKIQCLVYDILLKKKKGYTHPAVCMSVTQLYFFFVSLKAF